jgi:hypothetical protein
MEPFGFFSVEALRAGWYLIWRQLVRVVPLMAASVLVGYLLISRGLVGFGGFLMAIGLLVGIVWAAVLIPRLASQWSEVTYGFSLTGRGSVWWNISWRSMVASLVAAVVLTPPQMVATSLTASFKGSALGGLGALLTTLISLANFAVTLLATGWAMSRVALAQSGDFFDRVPAPVSPLGPTVTEPTLEPSPVAPVSAAPVAVAEPVTAAARVTMADRAPVAEPIAAPRPAAPPAPAVATASHDGKRQCPKCSLYETEQGKVIGWYCRVCGWRESRR